MHLFVLHFVYFLIIVYCDQKSLPPMWKITVIYDSNSFAIEFGNEKQITFESVISAVRQEFNLLKTFTLETIVKSSDSDGNKRVSIENSETLISVFDTTTRECRLSVLVLDSQTSEASPVIIVELFENTNDGNKDNNNNNNNNNSNNLSFEWKPSYLTDIIRNEDNKMDENEDEASISIDWESEYDGLIRVIRDRFDIKFFDEFSIKQVNDNDSDEGNDSDNKHDEITFDNDELACVWADVMEKCEEEETNSNIISGNNNHGIMLRVIVTRHDDNDELIEMSQTGPCDIAEDGVTLLDDVYKNENENHSKNPNTNKNNSENENKKEKEKGNVTSDDAEFNIKKKLTSIGVQLGKLKYDLRIKLGGDSEMEYNHNYSMANDIDERYFSRARSNDVDELISKLFSLFNKIKDYISDSIEQQNEFLRERSSEVCSIAQVKGW